MVAATSPRAEARQRKRWEDVSTAACRLGRPGLHGSGALLHGRRLPGRRTTSGQGSSVTSTRPGPPARSSCRTSRRSMPTISADGKNYKFTLREKLKYSDGKPREGERLPVHDRAGLQDRLAGRRLLLRRSRASAARTGSRRRRRATSPESSRTTPPHDRDPARSAARATSSTSSRSSSRTSCRQGRRRATSRRIRFPATGPYMLQSYVPNRSFTLVRNPNYNNQIPTMPTGAPDKVVGKIITDPVASYQSVVSGKSDYDYNQVPNDRLPEAQSKYKDQLRIYTNANTYYFALNNKIPPFNNIKARQAVNYAIDPSGDRLRHLRRSRAADAELPAAGLPAVQEDHRLHVRPRQGEAARPAVRDGGPDRRRLRHERGAVQGVDRVPGRPADRRSATSRSCTCWRTASISRRSGTRRPRPRPCYTDWYQDYPHPLDWFDVLLNGNRITADAQQQPGQRQRPVGEQGDRRAQEDHRASPRR